MLKTLASCLVATTAMLSAGLAQASEYPERTIRLIVPTSPGSTADVVARIVADDVGKRLQQTFVVENLAGAAGIPGTRQLVSSKPDGYTLAIVSSNHAINPSLYQEVPYDAVDDITMVSVIGTTPLALVVAADSPYENAQALLDAARKAPGKLDYGSAGVGSVLHMAGELLKSQAGIDMMHVPYRGGTLLATDVMSGQIDAAFLAVPSILGSVQGGKLKALAVSTPERVAALSNVPTLAESGVDGYAYDAWLALIGPADLPADVVATLQLALRESLTDEAMVKTLQAQGFVPTGTETSEAMTILTTELQRSAELVKAAGIAMQ